MNTGISAIALTLSLLGLSACSSADGDEPTADKSPSSTAATPSGDASSAAPAVRMRGADDSARWTDCVPYTEKQGDFLWSGPRLTADADAQLERVALPGAHGVHVVGVWVAAADHAAGAFVPWSMRHEFLRKMDWAHHTDAKGAQLTAGTKYSMVFRLRPDVGQLPAELTDLTIGWKADADGSTGQIRNDDVLQFAKHC